MALLLVHSQFLKLCTSGIGEEMLIQEVGGGTDWGEIILNLGGLVLLCLIVPWPQPWPVS